ncbi:uncharacterized protein Z520_08913 [Fonsecaea multimorphosa CBS 102226]|uniref:Uncharacterized protein n=1 Tax=Fonsecaea multimorphosa CBS 102226 TaxID=1442371 RepID=A0A0D2IE55_9EURO|nr:uncharacterized protein Z520_08913 [Fonsecaea multimorphosa CBS 102226]KIX95396.1 hypothetical protein Z520_08913 [Fonsecaea multimorphosa CBS 102226]OAL21062.1 hypothetical protein AYO22_08346 [Fonsecaea multimorphosa]
MSASSDRDNKPSLPKFEPLPPTNFLNRLINRILAPLFYLVFTLITSIVVVPVYVMIDSFRHGRSKSGGERVARDESSQYPGQADKTNKASSFLREYGRSYGGTRKSEKTG